MHPKKTFIVFIATGMLMVITAGIWLATAKPVSAQCGSQASSCKDCHEVQSKDPVNADGTGWHQSHAFGDFCYICHGGNTQSTEQEAAHTGMVAPMDDVKASCLQCHPKDLAERAKVYADTMGVTAGGLEAPKPTETPAATTGSETVQPTEAAAEPVNNIPADKTVVIAQPAHTVDYVARYNENVLGIRKVNWSLIGLVSLAVVIVIGAAMFVAIKKGWLAITFETFNPSQNKKA